MEFGDLLTTTGLAAFCLLVVGVVKTTLPAFDSARFGALLSIGIGIASALAANAASVADVQMSIPEAVFLGVIAGATASGVYDAASGPSNG